MKNLFKFCALALLILPTSSCLIGNYDVEPAGINLRLKSIVVNSNATKAGESFEKTYSIDIRKEFVDRFNLNPDELVTLNLLAGRVTFNQNSCDKLQSYEVSAIVPAPVNISFVENRCNLPLVTNFEGVQQPGVIQFDATSNDPRALQVTQANFAPTVKAGGTLDIKFKMKAAQDIPAGFGVEVYLQIVSTYKPKKK